MASRSLGSLTLDLIARTQGFVSGMDAAERKSMETNKRIQRETQKTIDTIDGWAKAAGAAAAAVAVALAYATQRSIEHIAAQNDLAEAVGATHAELVSLGRAAELSGVSSDSLAVAMKRLNNTIGDAQGGSASAASAFDRLGLSADTLASMPMSERFAAISAAVSHLGTQTERAAAMQDIFGKSGQDLLPMLQDGGAALELAAKQAEQWGLALSQIQVQKIAEADDALSNVSAVFTGLQNQLAAAFAPAVTVASERITDLAQSGKGFGDAMFEAFRVSAMGVSYVIDLVAALNGVIKTGEVGTNSVALAFNLTAMAVDQVALAIDRVLGTDTQENMKRRQQVITGTVAASMARVSASWEDMQKTMSEPLPHYAVEKFFDDVRKKASETSTAVKGALSGGGQESSGVGSASKENKDKSSGIVIVPYADVMAEQAKTMDEMRAQQMAADKFASDTKRAQMAEDLAIEESTAEASAEAWRKVTEAKAKEYQKNADFFTKGLDVIARGTSKASKAVRALQLADALTEIFINTKRAVMGAYAWGTSIGGPVLGGVFAGTAAAFGATVAAETVSQSRGGGGSASVPSAGISPSVASTASSAPASQVRQAAVDIRLVGAPRRPSWDEVAEILEMAGERIADSGGRIGKVTVLTA